MPMTKPIAQLFRRSVTNNMGVVQRGPIQNFSIATFQVLPMVQLSQCRCQRCRSIGTRSSVFVVGQLELGTVF